MAFPIHGHINTVNHPPANPETAMSQTTRPDPHDYTSARRDAEHLRGEAVDDFWRGANAMLDRVALDARARLARSTQRLQARLRRQRAGTSPGLMS